MWHIMMRTLEGQGPKIQSILVDPVKLTYDDLTKVMDENCNLNSAEWLKVGADRWGYNSAYLDNFFLRPADPRAFKKK